MLEGIKVTKRFGGLTAVDNVDFLIRKKEIVGLIGPNGAGKTTLFNCISGIYRPTSGTIEFNGRDITNLKPHKICKLGIGRTFQLVRPFLEMTVLENVIVGARFGSSRSISIREARNEALYYLEFVRMAKKKEIMAKNLTLYDRRLTEVASARAREILFSIGTKALTF